MPAIFSRPRNNKIDKRLILLGVVSIAFIGILLLLGPVKQASNYHKFADTRTFLAIPNFWNVVSNLPFLVIGFLGIKDCIADHTNNPENPLQSSKVLFFIGVFLTGIGSCYYHWNPDNSTLFWDRLPLTIIMMTIFCMVVEACVSKSIAKRLLIPLVLSGIASSLYWRFTELSGHGDLRPYLLAQFLPMLLTPLILWLYEGNKRGCRYVWYVLGLYLLAKIAEHFDKKFFEIFSLLSGHTVKHLLAAAAIYCVYAANTQNLREDDL